MFFEFNPFAPIIEMVEFNCNICGNRDWVFPRNDKEFWSLSCTCCHSYLWSMINKKQVEKNIDTFRETQY